jgi:hypothetical protein
VIKSKNGKLFTRENTVFSTTDDVEWPIGRILEDYKILVLSNTHYNARSVAHYRMARELALKFDLKVLMNRYPLMLKINDNDYLNLLLFISEEFSRGIDNSNTADINKADAFSYREDYNAITRVIVDQGLLT